MTPCYPDQIRVNLFSAAHDYITSRLNEYNDYIILFKLSMIEESFHYSTNMTDLKSVVVKVEELLR